MSKPDDIPDDVWGAAFKHLAGGVGKARHNAEPVEPQEIIARAILSERTKAAEIAESMFTPDSVNKNSKGKPYYAGEIAISCSYRISQSIRKGGKE